MEASESGGQRRRIRYRGANREREYVDKSRSGREKRRHKSRAIGNI